MFARRAAVRHPAPSPIQHVVLVILENTNYDTAMAQPFLKSLASQGALLTNYFALTAPSQPNYIALMSGSQHGVIDDATLTLDVRHLGDLMEVRGLDWRVYAEAYPGNCFTGSNANNGSYVRRHVPFLEFKNVIANRQRCNAHVFEASQLDADVASGQLPSFALYIPDQKNNSHDTSIAFADLYMQNRFGPLLRDERFTEGTLFIVTFDESSGLSRHVATILWGAGVTPNGRSSRVYDHYDPLRTIEEIFHAGTLSEEDERTGEPIRDVLTFP
ncbi:MAG TPA: alkaline phosphatase family protein [Thermoanaerobaculia bacterium]